MTKLHSLDSKNLFVCSKFFYFFFSLVYQRNIYGSIHGDPSTFWKEFFFWFFFGSICRRGLENTFGEKKLRTFLPKIARSRSFFRNVFGIARNMQKISGKSGNISKKNISR